MELWTLVVVWCTMSMPQDCIKLRFEDLTWSLCTELQRIMIEGDTVLQEDGTIDMGPHIVRSYPLRRGEPDTQGDGP